MSLSKEYPEAAVNTNCTEFEVNKWIVSDFILDRIIPAVGFHPFPLDELLLMCSIVVRYKPKYIFEWGTHVGKSARIFYEVINAFGIDCEIHSIDLPENAHHEEHPRDEYAMFVKNFCRAEIGSEQRRQVGSKNVILHRGDGLEKSMELYKRFGHEAVVMFFVDGDHRFESVKRELETLVKEAENSIILLHDTFYQSKESNYNVGPHNAIKDVLDKNHGKFKVTTT